ncbi:3-hydroxyacyl-CoA dehydrogenase, NAD binding domain protein [Cooperia oncophora]
MDMKNASDDVKTYIRKCTAESVQWRLPNGGNWQNSKAATVRNVAVIGGGTMGRGIAISLAQAGYHTTLVENDSESLENCRRELKTTYAREQKLGRLTPDQCEKLTVGIHLTTDLTTLKDCDLVIEAVFEIMKLKTDLFAKLNQICSPTTIFGTNTSSLNIDEARSTSRRESMSLALNRPENLVGIHFFNPAHIIKMVEVVYGKNTSAEAVATAFAVCTQMSKVWMLQLI